jgi:hypothetical protein
VAELVAGRGRSVKSFLYVFVDTFIGGGLVLDSHLRGGVTGNAGAVGSMPIWNAALRRAAASQPAQLLSVASLLTLERAYASAGLDPRGRGRRARAAGALAAADPGLAGPRRPPASPRRFNSAACLLDLEAAIVDGNFSRELRPPCWTTPRRRWTAATGKAWPGLS